MARGVKDLGILDAQDAPRHIEAGLERDREGKARGAAALANRAIGGVELRARGR
jgi:hypothetical protein